MVVLNPSNEQVGTVSLVRVAVKAAGLAMASVLFDLLRRYREVRAIEHLMAMETAQLKDLGISRSEIVSAVRTGRRGPSANQSAARPRGRILRGRPRPSSHRLAP